jgi:hypothetical protein
MYRHGAAADKTPCGTATPIGADPSENLIYLD